MSGKSLIEYLSGSLVFKSLDASSLDLSSIWSITREIFGLWQGSHEAAGQWSLNFIGVQEPWLRILVVILALVLLSFSWSNLKELSSVRRRLQILFLRLLATVALILMILEPQLEFHEMMRIRNAVAILLDTSRSMSLQDKGEPRLEAIRKYLKSNENFLRSLEEDFEVSFYAFSDKIEEAGRGILERAITPEGTTTDFGTVLRELAKRYENKPTSGFLLFSDGADTSHLPRLERLKELELTAKNLPAPIYTFSPSPEPYRDIAITGITYDNFAFIRNPLNLELKVKVKGYEEMTLPVLLKEGENILVSKALRIQKGVEEYTVPMETTPHAVGDYLFTITIPPLSDELIRENNTVKLMLQVIRDKIRVLHLCGRPSWDEIFLRRVLKRDPSVDLVSFFILRTPGDLVEATGRELSLIPFPAEELFTRALESFDLVIFQNFDYRPYDAALFRFGHYLANVERYVMDYGGGFLMVGGDLSFAHGGYDGTAVEEILPVELNEGLDAVDTRDFKPQLTPQGLTHPITSLDYDPERNRKLWEGLPGLKGYNKVRTLKKDAIALSIHPEASAPLLAVTEMGKGRVMAFLTDDSWRWNFLSIGHGGSNRNYIKFWRNSVRWLIKDPELNLVRVATEKKEYMPEEMVHIKTEVLGKDYKPLPGARVNLTIISAETGDKVLEELLESNNEGHAYLSFKPKEGYYYVKAKALHNDEKSSTNALGEAVTIFGVKPPLEEFREPWVEESFLERIAMASGGKHFSLPVKDIEKNITLKNPIIQKPMGKKTTPLWDNWLFFSIILISLSTEWWLRKKAGVK